MRMAENFQLPTQHVWARFIIPVGLVIISLFLAQPVRAQESPTDSSQVSTTDKCVPACRQGFTCRAGVCASPCNPPCSKGDICTRNGACIPASTGKPPVASSHAGTTHAGSYNKPSSHHNSWNQKRAYGQYDEPTPRNSEELNRLEQKRTTSGGLMALGIVIVVGAAVMGFFAGFQGSEELLFAAIGVEVLGHIFLWGGMASRIKAGNQIKKLALHDCAPPTRRTAWLTDTRHAHLSELEQVRSRGLLFSWSF